MNRTDRLYALVEELRAVAPRPRSSRWLARRFEICTRTVERDISALQQSGVPIYAEPGRTGGYVLDRSRTLPPVNVTPEEAVAIAAALPALAGTPFQEAARSALLKILAAMPESDADSAEVLARRVHLLRFARYPDPSPVPRAVAESLTADRVLRLDYLDRHGAVTERVVEPLGFLSGGRCWYLLAWCRLRDDMRTFRLDRIRAAEETGETVPPRGIDAAALGIPDGVVSQITLRLP